MGHDASKRCTDTWQLGLLPRSYPCILAHLQEDASRRAVWSRRFHVYVSLVPPCALCSTDVRADVGNGVYQPIYQVPGTYYGATEA
jgi:hypothetical protein